MTVSDADLDELLAMLDRGRQSWIDGTLGFGEGLEVDQDDDFTIIGPFGGEPGRGPGLEERQKAAARLFHGGTGSWEVVKTIVSGDLAVVVLVERNEACGRGRPRTSAVGSTDHAGVRTAAKRLGATSPACRSSHRPSQACSDVRSRSR